MTIETEKTIRSLLSDIDAMRCKPPYDIREDGGEEDQKHWFGGFGNTGINEPDDLIVVEWPNLSILAEKLQKLLIDRVMIGRPLDR